MQGIRIMLLSLMTLLLLGCQGEVQYATPLRPVHYELYFATNGRALTATGGYMRITRPSTATSAIGFGGILVIHGFAGSGTADYYYAYDLACPKELDPTNSLVVNEKLEAVCPKCHSRFSIVYGGGMPIQGPAQSPLLPYRVLPIDGGIRITAPEL